MADAFKLKQRIIKALAVVHLEEVEPRSTDVKFALKCTPFQAQNFVVAIEYLPKLDILRVIASVGIGKNLKDSFKTKTEPEKNEISILFSKPLRARNFNPMIAKDFSAVEGFKFLIQQNFSSQMLLDTISEAIFVLQELGELFSQADQSLQVPNVSESAKNMFG